MRDQGNIIILFIFSPVVRVILEESDAGLEHGGNNLVRTLPCKLVDTNVLK